MFVRRSTHAAAVAALEKQLAELRARHDATERDLASKTAIVGFLCARVNQVEGERVALLKHALHDAGITLPLPQLSAAVPVTGDAAAALSGLPADMFADMGDEAARDQGIHWNERGGVEYGRRPVTATA